MYLGIDFGTTNTSLALADADGKVTVATFATEGGETRSFRSILCFVEEGSQPPKLSISAGPQAVEDLLDHGSEARIILSIKKFLASAGFTTTSIFGRSYKLEDLVALILTRALGDAQNLPAPLPETVAVGRPVVFGGESSDEALGIRRLEAAFGAAGFEEVSLQYEPLAAAYFYLRGLKRPETFLVADFGGGTTDFSLVRLEPPEAGSMNGGPKLEPLAHAGLAIAGDTFDYRIVQNVVCPRLGQDSFYRSFDQRLRVPRLYYESFERWHRLSLMRNAKLLREIKQVQQTSEEPGKLADLIYVIEEELGLLLYQAVSRTKVDLSTRDRATFDFTHGPIAIRQEISRSDFEAWIAADLEKIAETIDGMLGEAAMDKEAVSKVFMTGGSSLVPAVRRIFEDRFSPERLVYGDEFTSVAAGLALLQRDRMSAA